jgi:Holliday junction resolvase RusA-like endonuclease
MSYRLEFELPGLPDSPNRRQNASWKSTHFRSKKWKDWVCLKTCGYRPPAPLPRARVTLLRFSSVEMDPDNLAASFKPILDGLQIAQVILNDRRKNIDMTFGWRQWAKNAGKIRVIVEEIEE